MAGPSDTCLRSGSRRYPRLYVERVRLAASPFRAKRNCMDVHKVTRLTARYHTVADRSSGIQFRFWPAPEWRAHRPSSREGRPQAQELGPPAGDTRSPCQRCRRPPDRAVRSSSRRRQGARTPDALGSGCEVGETGESTQARPPARPWFGRRCSTASRRSGRASNKAASTHAHN